MCRGGNASVLLSWQIVKVPAADIVAAYLLLSSTNSFRPTFLAGSTPLQPLLLLLPLRLLLLVVSAKGLTNQGNQGTASHHEVVMLCWRLELKHQPQRYTRYHATSWNVDYCNPAAHA